MASPGSTTPSCGFAVEATFEAPRMTLALKGELDLAGVPLLNQEIEALPWPQLAELVFDLSDLTFIDCQGVSVLIRTSHRATAADLRFSVIRVTKQPRMLFEIAGVTHSLNLEG